MTDLDAIRARAANIATGSVYSQQQTAADYQALLAEIDRRTTDLIAEQSVRQDEWDHASELLKDGVKSVSHWEQQVARVRALHQRCECRRELDISLTPIVHCDCCDEEWPCLTIQALEQP